MVQVSQVSCNPLIEIVKNVAIVYERRTKRIRMMEFSRDGERCEVCCTEIPVGGLVI